MFHNRSHRPALAYAASDKPATQINNKKSPFVFSAGTETEDFNAFGSGGQPRERQKKEQGKPSGYKGKLGGLNKKTLLIAAGAVVAFILLLVLAVTLFTSGPKDIKMQDNTFVVYNDGSNIYKVAMNGVTVATNFANTVEIEIAKNNAFAYVTEEMSDGSFNLFVLKDKTLTQLNDGPLSGIVAKASLAVAAVWKETDTYYLYEDGARQTLSKNVTAANFVISDSGRYVLYTDLMEDGIQTRLNKLDAKGGQADVVVNNRIPVAVSNDGKYVYAYGRPNDQSDYELNCFVGKSRTKIEKSQNFSGFLYMNSAGNEILFTVTSEGSIPMTYYYKHGSSNAEALRVGDGKMLPLTSHSKVAVLKTLKHALLSNEADAAEKKTSYINNKYVPKLFVSMHGQLDPQGKYFYYISSQGDLVYREPKSATQSSSQVARKVKSFVITNKGNIYFVDENGTLYFRKKSWQKPESVKTDIDTEMVFHRGSNTLYFIETDGIQTFSTKEGKAPKTVTWAKHSLVTIPAFSDPLNKKSFATVYDADNDSYIVYYTANGTSYKKVSEYCVDVYSSHSFTDKETPDTPEPPAQT